MFNLDFIAANTGASMEQGVAQVFANEDKTSDASGSITLAADPIAVVTGGGTYAWVRKATEGGAERTRVNVVNKVITGLDANTEYCIMYRKVADGRTITISSQFIPDTLHAILTVALYTGDSCNVDAATKAGEVVIDIPRLQLSGAMDISMTASGAAQTPLEGNALASGCTGCDGKAIYATISEVITGSHWYDDAAGLIIEDLSGIKAGDTVNKNLVVYAYYTNGAPKQLDLAELTITNTLTNIGLSINTTTGAITGTAVAGTGNLTVVCTAKPALETNKNIVVTA